MRACLKRKKEGGRSRREERRGEKGRTRGRRNERKETEKTSIPGPEAELLSASSLGC